MTFKKSVRIRIHSETVQEEGTKDSSIQEVKGEVFLKGGSTYIRYQEPDPSMGAVSTTVKWAGDELKIIRHGSVESEQIFIPLRQTRGFYKTAQVKLDLEIRTERLEAALFEGTGSVRWCYDLFVAGGFAGRYTINLDIHDQK